MNRRHHILSALLSALILPIGLAGCSSGEKTLTEADGGTPPVDPVYDAVFVILDRSCVPCHHSSDERPGLLPMEDGRDYDDCEGIERDLDDILDSCVENERMPPGAWPRLTEEEKLVIRQWVDAGACSPCRTCR